MDSYAYFNFDAKVNRSGWYTFNFINVDDRDTVLEVKTIHVSVEPVSGDAKKLIISPDEQSTDRLKAGLADTLAVKWKYYPGGEGVMGGWRLKETKYSDVQPAGGQ